MTVKELIAKISCMSDHLPVVFTIPSGGVCADDWEDEYHTLTGLRHERRVTVLWSRGHWHDEWRPASSWHTQQDPAMGRQERVLPTDEYRVNVLIGDHTLEEDDDE